MNWLKLYSTEPVFSGRWGHCDEHLRNKSKEYARMIQSLKDEKIKFEGFDQEEKYWISVDTVTFVTEEFRLDPSSDWFDWKSHGSGLKYEFALALRRAKIVSVRGPAKPGREQDSVMFRGGGKDDENLDKTALYHLLTPGRIQLETCNTKDCRRR